MKQCLCIILCLVAIAAMAACRPTSMQNATVNKGDATLEEKIQAEPVAAKLFEAPSALHWEPFGTEELQVVVDAEVFVPDVTQYPVVEIEQRVITPEWAGDLMQKMANGNPIYTYENEIPQTKSQIQEEVSLLQEMLANPENYLPAGATDEVRSTAVSEWQESLLGWQQAYQTAPDAFVEQEIDVSSHAFAASGQISGAVDLGKNRKAYLTVVGLAGGTGGSVEFNNLDDGVGLPFQFDLETDFSDLNGVTINKDEAVRLGLAYIESLGETGFAPSLILAGYCDPRGEAASVTEDYPQCYKILFTRSVNGVPTTYRESKYDLFAGFEPSSEDKAGGAEEQYAPYCPQEYVELMVRDSGINYMYWETPCTQTRVLNENVELLPFDDVMERFQSQVLFESFPTLDEGTSVVQKTLVIEKIELGMMQIRKKNAANTLLMVPAWTFFGRTVLRYADPQTAGYPLNADNEYVSRIPGYSYLIMNAVDGSIIHPALGY